ncbi:hypothetical protein HMI54_006953 [Coelomomyces lativittatus]|nr:hypothetical protein HMI54_006953 [Coelomomyces lativittatus]KAJ1508712.1 hypothetical protein HMI55_000274 [Coelomomyces lativittatus]
MTAYCSNCGNIIHGSNNYCPCGGNSVQSLTSGFSKNENARLSPSSGLSKTSTLPATPTFPKPQPSHPPNALDSSQNIFHSKKNGVEAQSKPIPSPMMSASSTKPNSLEAGTNLLKCSMCLEPLNLNSGKKSWDDPNLLYCQGCWQIRPKPTSIDLKPRSTSELKSTLNFQLGLTPNPSIAPTTLLPSSSSITSLRPSVVSTTINKPSIRCLKCHENIPQQVLGGSSLCKKCQSCESSSFVTLPDAKMHYCFRCKEIQPKKYFVLPDQQLICDKCWVCSACNKPIRSGTYALEDDLIIHPEVNLFCHLYKDYCIREYYC